MEPRVEGTCDTGEKFTDTTVFLVLFQYDDHYEIATCWQSKLGIPRFTSPARNRNPPADKRLFYQEIIFSESFPPIKALMAGLEKFMRKNVGNKERVVRSISAAVMTTCFFMAPFPLAIRSGFLVAGVYMAFTALSGFCLAGKLAGRQACEIPERKA